MKSAFVCFSFLAIVAMIVPISLAGTIDYTDPANNPTAQTWRPVPEDFPLPPDFPIGEMPYGSGNDNDPENGEPIYVPFPQNPTEFNNPYGSEPPTAHGEPGWEWEWTEGWGGNPPIITWHFEGMDPENPNETTTMTLAIPNNPENNPYKEITWSIISDKAPKLGENGFFVSVDTTGSNHPYTVSNPMPQPGPIQLGGGSSDGGAWYQYNGVIRIEPNPEYEYLTFEFFECTNIAEIKVQTVCVPVPEPGMLALLVSAGIGVAVLRRRRG